MTFFGLYIKKIFFLFEYAYFFVVFFIIYWFTYDVLAFF